MQGRVVEEDGQGREEGKERRGNTGKENRGGGRAGKRGKAGK